MDVVTVVAVKKCEKRSEMNEESVWDYSVTHSMHSKLIWNEIFLSTFSSKLDVRHLD